MKKGLKKGLLWGGGILVVGGVATAIIVPTINNGNTTRVVQDKLNKEGSIGSRGKSVGDIGGDIEEEQNLESTVLPKAESNISKSLYVEEQAGSVEIQKMYFEWEIYRAKKKLIEIITDAELINYTDTTYTSNLINKPATINSMDFETIKNKAIELKDGLPSTDSTEEDRKTNITNKITAQVEIFENVNKKIENIENNFDSLFDQTNWSSEYPKLLLPITIIRDRQSKIYEDTKRAYIEAGTGNGDSARLEWAQTEISTRYGGATSDEQAIDYLVEKQVKSRAFTRFNYSLNSDFTIEMVTSKIFDKLLGILVPVSEDNPKSIDGLIYINSSLPTDKSIAMAQKVYFMGTKSYVFNKDGKNFFNPGKDNIDTEHIGEYAKVRNAIIGISPNFDDSSAAWGFGAKIEFKEAIKNILTASTYDKSGTPTLVWGPQNGKDIYGTDEDLTKQLVGNVTGTRDTSRWQSGDYGWKATLDNVKGVVPGFANGVIAGLRDMIDDSTITAVTNPSNVISQIFAGIKNSFDSYLLNVGNVPIADPTVTTASQYNAQVSRIIENADEEILKAEFGAALRSNMSKIDIAPGQKLINDNGEMQLFYDFGGDAKSHKYLMITKDFGMHLIQIQKGDSIKDDLYSDLQVIADEQSTKSVTTNYEDILSTLSDTTKKLMTMLNYDDTTKGSESISGEYLDMILANKDSIFADGNISDEDAKKMIIDLIKAYIVSEGISKVQEAYPESNIEWIENTLYDDSGDKNRVVNPLNPFMGANATFNPWDIYQWAYEVEGVK